MKTVLLISTPLIFILVILFSVWTGLFQPRDGNNSRWDTKRSLAVIVAGLTTCPLTALLIQLGQLKIPSLNLTFLTIAVATILGFLIGLIYLWLIRLTHNNIVTNQLFVLFSVSVSVISLYFFVFHSQIQEFVISSAWGFLFGVLFYVTIKGGLDISLVGKTEEKGNVEILVKEDGKNRIGKKRKFATNTNILLVFVAFSCLLIGYGMGLLTNSYDRIAWNNYSSGTLFVMLGIGAMILNEVFVTLLSDKIVNRIRKLSLHYKIIVFVIVFFLVVVCGLFLSYNKP